MGSVKLFGLATRGVNVVEAPTHLSVEEVTSAQNVEVVSDAGENALDQRPGMSKVNAAALNGSVVMAQDVPSDVLLTKTPTLYAGLYTGSTHNWRKTTDGTTWTNDDTLAKNVVGTGVAATAKDYPRAVTIKGKLYYPGGATGVRPITIHQFDGTTDKIVTSIPPAVSGATLTAPAAPAVTPLGTTGATAYSYKAVAILSAAHSAASTAGPTTIGNAALTADNYNTLALSTPGAGVVSYDIYRTVGGATQGKIGSVPVVAGSLTNSNGSPVALPVPSAPSISTFPAGTTYTYLVVAHNGSAVSARSAGTTIANGPTTLNGSTYNAIFSTITYSTTPWTTLDVYRTVGGATQGKIGVITYPATSLNDTGLVGDGTTAPAASSGTAPYSTVYPTLANTVNFVDAGLTGDATTAPSTPTGSTAGDALSVMDTITDGTSLILAVLDMAGADPVVYGRILKYTPSSNTWSQMGANLPLALGNGCPGALAFYGGTLSFATYAGTTAGNTTYVNNVGLPLPAGGVQETHTTAVSQYASSMAVFNGDLYVGLTFLGATAATLVKRVPVATWSTSLTAPSAIAQNGWPSMAVFNGYLFAGWYSGDAVTAAKVYSTIDGITWTLELTTSNAQVPGQMVVFNNKLYVVFSAYGGLSSHTYQRDTLGVWTLVDTQTDTLSGALGVVYV